MPVVRRAVTLGRAEIRALLAEHGLRPSRALGQHFVADPNTVRRVVRLARVGPGDRVVEIGAGLGSLTLALAQSGAEVVAIEADRRLIPVLRDVVDGTGARVVHADATRLGWDEVLGGGPAAGCGTAAGGPWTLVANLPYNVATPLVLDVLESVPAVGRMLVMVQHEVAERLAARPGRRAYGAVTVKVAYFATAAIEGEVPASVFIPEPKVRSALVRIERGVAPAVPLAVATYAEIRELVDAGFAVRRKMLRNALAGLVAGQAFERAGIAPTARAEELSVEDWGRLVAAERSNVAGSQD